MEARRKGDNRHMGSRRRGRNVAVGVLGAPDPLAAGLGASSGIAAARWQTFGKAYGRSDNGPFLSVESQARARRVRYVIANPAGRSVTQSWSVWCEKGYDSWYRSGSRRGARRSIVRSFDVRNGYSCRLDVTAYTNRSSYLG
jgi:hypothetical protein